MYQVYQTYISMGHAAIGGWYLYAIIVPESLLLYKGLEVLMRGKIQRLAPFVLIGGACILQFLGHFCKAIPYYAGFNIPRFNPKHLLEVYSPEGLRQVMEQLSLNKPAFITPAVTGIAIGAYVLLMLTTLFFYVRITRPRRYDL